MDVCVPCARLVSTEARRKHSSLGTGDTDCCEMPYEYWEVNNSSLEEYLVFLTAEAFLQPTTQ